MDYWQVAMALCRLNDTLQYDPHCYKKKSKSKHLDKKPLHHIACYNIALQILYDLCFTGGVATPTPMCYQAEGSHVASPLSLNTQERDLLRYMVAPGPFLLLSCR